jgi:two-component system, sensor histidine kinase and response regulator
MSKILVIDDETWLREMIRLALTQREFEVIEASGSEEGFAQARENLPDLILCDVNMDKAGAGYTMLEKLREDNATAAIPFILMTGLADAKGMRHGMELGADDYLPKPFKIEELYAAVDARLRKVRTVREEAERKLSQLRNQITLMLPHEMRTPLNGIISNAELLAISADALRPAEIAEMGREIAQSGQRLERLIENFLIFAQLEIVANDPENIRALRAATTLHPGEIVRATAVNDADHCGRLPDLVLEAEDTPVAMAEDYFKKIVTELVQNAFKFSPAGSPVRVRLVAADGKIELSVRDQGQGFSTENIRRIDAYVQFERKMQDREGLGLGLTIAKKLVELHGGSLLIEGVKDSGSLVTVKLPLAKAPENLQKNRRA